MESHRSLAFDGKGLWPHQLTFLGKRAKNKTVRAVSVLGVWSCSLFVVELYIWHMSSAISSKNKVRT